jgi:hypothetical protein
VGRSYGRRIESIRSGLLCVFLVAFIHQWLVAADVLIRPILSDPSIAEKILAHPLPTARLLASGTAWFALSGAFGLWRGRKSRLAAYLSLILHSLAPESRETLVQLATEEATRLRSRALAKGSGPLSNGQPAQSSSPGLSGQAVDLADDARTSSHGGRGSRS